MSNYLTDLLAAILFLGLAGCASRQAETERTVDREKLASANTKLAFQYMRDKEYEIALKKLEKALSADPNYVDAHNAMGLLNSQLGRFDDAERSFKKALRLDADNSSTLNNYGQFLCQRGRYEEGKARFLEAVANPLYKRPALALSNAGTCAMDAGHIDVAETHFRTALEKEERLAPALIQMADISLRLERHLAARGYLQRYQEVAPHTAKSLWLGIRIERLLDDRDVVSSYALLLEKGYPDSNELRQYLESKGQ